MSKVCDLTGKKKSTGSKVSHSNRHTKRTFSPNVSKKNIIDPLSGKKIKVRLSTNAKRTLIKNPAKFSVALAKIVKKQSKRASK